MYTEQTQFSMTELHGFLKSDRGAPGSASLSKREQAMDTFSKTVTGRDFEAYGGEDNVQRVRVLADVKDAALPVKYEFVTKLPMAALADKKAVEQRAATRAAREAALITFKLLLAVDPKKAAEFMKTEGHKVLDRTVVITGLEMVQEALKAAKKVRQNIATAGKRVAAMKRPIVQRVPKAKQGTYTIPAKAIDAYALALEQDRLNRVKASKEAAANLRKKAS